MRNGIPLDEYELTDSIDTGITSNMEFLELQALNVWGASLEQLDKWRNGELDPSLLQLAKAYFLGDRIYQSHKQDAISIEQKSQAG